MTFDELRDDFLRIVSEVVWCTVATVDTRGRPRTRIMHPYWEVVDGAPLGWVGTSKSPLKTRHLAANPHVSCAYWSPKQETAHVECRASWADDERERVWQLFRGAEPPLGYDPAAIPQWRDGPLAGRWAVLRLEPWRLMLLTAEDAAAGNWYKRVWRAGAGKYRPTSCCTTRVRRDGAGARAVAKSRRRFLRAGGAGGGRSPNEDRA